MGIAALGSNEFANALSRRVGFVADTIKYSEPRINEEEAKYIEMGGNKAGGERVAAYRDSAFFTVQNVYNAAADTALTTEEASKALASGGEAASLATTLGKIKDAVGGAKNAWYDQFVAGTHVQPEYPVGYYQQFKVLAARIKDALGSKV